MFVKDTQIFTDSAWKNIQDISGNDRVLVKNFLGDAEFIQPFALKKRKYEGEVIQKGAEYWSFTVTPDHSNLDREQVVRRFKYMFADEPKKEYVTIYDDFGKRYSTISHQDWYKLCAYVLMRGFIKTGYGKPMLYIFLEQDRVEEEIIILGDILDRIGVPYHVQYSEKTRPKVVVSSRNTLAARLTTRLGSNKRKEMFLPDKMIYSSTKELSKLLIETIIDSSIKPDTKKRTVYQLATTNKKLLDSLTLLGTLSGYSMRIVLKRKAGVWGPKGFTQKDSYILQISDPIAVYTPKYTKKLNYSGYVYGIDLFEGEVYVKEGSKPVWMSPR